MNRKGASRFGLGIVLGAITGAISGLLLAPKSGKKMRADAIKTYNQLKKLLDEKKPEEIVADIFGKVTEETKTFFNQSKDLLARHLSELKVGIDKIDKEKYKKAVGAVVGDLRSQGEISDDSLDKLRKYLEGDFRKLTTPKKRIKKIAKKSTKTSRKP